ncbi:MAG: response regulator [Rickettsiales bacterium]
MLIIDEHAETALVNALEAVRAHESLSARCLYFSLAGRTETTGELHRVVIEAASRHIAEAHPEIYILSDGDVSILTRNIATRHLHLLMLDVAGYLNIPADDALATVYDLEVSIHALLSELEQKEILRHAALEELKKRYAQEQLRRRRQAILDSDMQPILQDVSARRKTRGTPELMVIEDDVFSRRLVENVLKKQYPLTALATAELALATYTNLAPDVLFLDINLPDVSGHELLRKVLAIDPNAYVVMLSGNADQANIMQAMKAGAKGFIAKPFTREKLFQYIDRCPTLAQQPAAVH